jgi:hypothetical protein
MGMLFWEVTEDLDFTGKISTKIRLLKEFFVEKLKTKMEHTSIEWHDKRYTEDLIIGIDMK